MTERLKNSCCWSSSRESTFRECPKKYWYTYYGAWEGWPLNWKDARAAIDPLAAYLYRLKNMQPIVFFIGSTVHKVIENTVRETVHTKHLLPKEKIQSNGIALLQKGLEESSRQLWKKHPKKHANLLEDYYHLPRPQENELTEKVTRCLANWHDSEIAQKLLCHPHTTFGDVEKPMTFQLGEGMEGIVVYDLYLFWKKDTNESQLLIFDWKTGSENGRITKQLSAYALAAMVLQGTPLESIVLCPFYVAESSTAYKKIHLQQADIDSTKQEILHSMAEMKACHSAPVLPLPEKFACNQTAHCSSCPFLEVCTKANFQDKTRTELYTYVQ